MPKHLYYPIDESELIKDKGLDSFEIIMSNRTVKVNKAYIIKDPLDEDISIRKDWSVIIDYGIREDLNLHFKPEDITKIHESIWDEEFVTFYEAEQVRIAAEKQAKLEAEEKAKEEMEKSFEPVSSTETKDPSIYEKSEQVNDEETVLVDNTEYQEFNNQEEETENVGQE